MGATGRSIVRKVYPRKDPWSHKGEYGRLLVISGSKIHTGAPAVVGMSAMRAGADIIYFIGPRRAMDVTAHYFPTFINMPLEGDFINRTHVKDVFKFAESMRVNALVIGPGLTRTPQAKAAINEIIGGFHIPMVIDADALRALGDELGAIAGKEVIVTPHSDEFRAMTGIEVSTNLKERANIVKRAAKELNVTIILKGNSDVISDGKRVAINRTGNPFMTKGSFGDMLAGICGALLARRKNKLDIYDVACAAAYINGKAGDLAAKSMREGLIVTDAIDRIPDVIRKG